MKSDDRAKGLPAWRAKRARLPKHIGIQGVTRDIYVRKRAEEVLKRALAEWQTTFDSARDLIMLLDGESKVVRANHAVFQFIKADKDKVVGKVCCELIHGTVTPIDGCPLVKARKTKRHEDAELYLSDKGMWIWVTVDPVLDNEGNLIGFIHTARDIQK